MQSKIEVRSSASASSPKVTAVISMSGSPISWITLSRWRTSSSTSRMRLTFCVNFSSSLTNTFFMSSSVAGLIA